MIRASLGRLAGLAAITLAAACSPPPLQAGSAEVRLPAPVGMGQSGNNGLGVAGPSSPYVNVFPGTDKVLGLPTVKALALSRGDDQEIIFLRTDQVAVVEQVRTSVVEELKKRTGKDYDGKLVIGATHTHSGPGRFVPGELVGMAIADEFFPEWYERLVGAMADAAEQALKNRSPAELGHVVAQARDGHNDRRCEDMVDRRNSQVPVLAIRKEGVITDVLLSFAIHGTVVGISEHMFTQDVSGAIEERVENAFDSPVNVLFLNAWAGDMAPGNPAKPVPELPVPNLGGDYEKMESIGEYMAGIVKAAIGGVVYTREPEISSAAYRYGINRELMGYREGEFEYEFGGVFCGTPNATCESLERHEDLDDPGNCLAFPESEPAPMQGITVVGRVGGLHFATWSGEPSTQLGEIVMAGAREHEGVTDFMFIGYANGYLGYSLTEDDWWHGGYETVGGMWGPKQGDYMARNIIDGFTVWKTGKLPKEPLAPIPPPEYHPFEPLVPETALEVGKVVEQPAAAYPVNEVPRFTVNGNEPWHGTPIAVLQRETAPGVFEDVLRPNGMPYDSDTYGFRVQLTPEPAYLTGDEKDRKDREFRWTFEPIISRVGKAMRGEPTGTFRIKATVRKADGTPVEVTSSPFTVTSAG